LFVANALRGHAVRLMRYKSPRKTG